MFRSIRARIIAATAGCLVVALLLNTVINFQVTRQDNQQSQRDILTSTSASHNMAIADWVKSKMTVIASAQTVALSDDPVPVFKQLGFSPTPGRLTPWPAVWRLSAPPAGRWRTA